MAERVGAPPTHTDQEVRILRQVSSQINATLDLDEIFDVVLRTMDELFGFRHTLILLLDEGGETLRVVASRGYEGRGVGAEVKVGTGVIGMVAKKRRLLRMGSLHQQRSYLGAARRQMELAGRGAELSDVVELPGLPDAKSQIAIPMMIKDDLIGVFSVETEDALSFDEHDEQLVSIVANQSAAAINNARLFREEAQRSQELREAHERLRRLNETLEDRVRERTRELQAANRELHEAQAQLVQSGKMASIGLLAAGVAHEMNTPIASVVSSQDTLSRAVERLRDRLGADAGDDAASRLLDVIASANEVIGEGATRVDGIVRRLRSFTRLDEADLQSANLNEGIEDTIALLAPEVPDGISIETDLAELPPIPCFPAQLNQVFLNVIKNALEAIDGAGTVRITSRQVGDRVHVVISDDGRGIAPDHQRRIFEPGFSAGSKRVGASMGLAICYRIMQDHEGEIRVDSTPGEGSTFTLVLPTHLKK